MMLNYWNQLRPSERRTLSIGAVIAAILMLYLLLLEPAWQEADTLALKVEKQKSENASLKKMAAKIKQLQSASHKRAIRKNPGQSLLVVVDRTAKKNKLGDSLKRVEPDGSARVRVWLDNAAFDAVAKWLTLLRSKYQLEIESAVFDKVDAAGRVNVRLIFAEGST
ncbi:MAG TPA: type II secretion system protein M [Gammaproteobacteria bacterium]|nr:type II secretion system protein M [Gammaproteobacteria bacterium]